MEIQRVDLFDDEQCRRAYDITVASRAVGRPWDRPDGYEQVLLGFRHEDKSEPMEMWAAVEDGRSLGVAMFWLAQDDNTDKMWFQLDVDPAHRRRGVGTALVRLLEQRARAESRRELLSEGDVPPESGGGHPYERFAAATGFAVASTDVVRHLELPVDSVVLDRLATASATHWQESYHLETHLDGLPEHLVEGYCGVSNQLGVDAPTGAVDFEAESLTPERYDENLDLERRQGRRRVTTVAVHDASGDVVAYTDLILPAGAPDRAWQWGTLVRRDHRGHRLGTAVKVRNLERLQQDHPERTRAVTGNDETNSYMLDINVRLGFAVVELCRYYHRVLAD